MRRFPSVLLVAFLPGFLSMAGCSRPEEARWPTRNYSGVYSVRARVDSNTCGTEVFSPGDTLRFTLIQYPDNRARMDIPPVVSVPGSFRGDRLEAYATVPGAQEAAASAETLSGAADTSTGGADAEGRRDADTPRASEASGADSLHYRLKLDFEGTGFSGTYSVEQPPIGSKIQACRQEFQVEGSQALEDGA